MKVTYLYHSGYLVETTNYNFIFDCINPNELKLDEEKANLIFITHHHADHFVPEIFDLDGHFIVGFDVNVPPFINRYYQMKVGQTIKINELEIKAFGSTDDGVSFYIEDIDIKILYAGDLNNWHWKLESTAEEIETMNHEYLSIINEMKGMEVDLLFYPIDPRMKVDLDLGLNQLLERIKVKRIFPMHFSPDLTAIHMYYQSPSIDDRIVPVVERNSRY